MISLEAIALRRAAEQVAPPGREILRNPDWRAAKKPVSRTGRALSCVCGTCRRCKNRIAMRNRRALGAKAEPKPRGPSMALGRKCGHEYADGRMCRVPIADWNQSGLCSDHRRVAWDAAHRDRSKKAEAA